MFHDFGKYIWLGHHGERDPGAACRAGSAQSREEQRCAKASSTRDLTKNNLRRSTPSPLAPQRSGGSAVHGDPQREIHGRGCHLHIDARVDKITFRKAENRKALKGPKQPAGGATGGASTEVTPMSLSDAENRPSNEAHCGDPGGPSHAKARERVRGNMENRQLLRSPIPSPRFPCFPRTRPFVLYRAFACEGPPDSTVSSGVGPRSKPGFSPTGS